MRSFIHFYLNRLRERLWLKPLVFGVLSVGASLIAKLIENTAAVGYAPFIRVDTLETLLEIMASSMLVIATFAVGAMVAALASASDNATPRSFPLVMSDDRSQNALSAFIGAFIFSIVALIALKSGFYGDGGRFVLFIVTLLVFTLVVLTFVRWVDSIARLGRLANTIDKVEKVSAAAIARRREAPIFGASPVSGRIASGRPVFAPSIGYVQRIDFERLQEIAEAHRCRIRVAALPGALASVAKPLAHVAVEDGAEDVEFEGIVEAFCLGENRVFDDDPRFGLIVLAEVASRALSPAVNDPGTAIGIIGSMLRLLACWTEPAGSNASAVHYDRIEVAALEIDDLIDDAFTSVARDGAGTVEVAVRLQKAFGTLALMGHPGLKAAALRHSALALARAEIALELPEDLQVLRSVSPCLQASPGI